MSEDCCRQVNIYILYSFISYIHFILPAVNKDAHIWMSMHSTKIDTFYMYLPAIYNEGMHTLLYTHRIVIYLCMFVI